MSHPSRVGRFLIVRQVGAGGMGTVYEAIDPTIDRRVAIKLLKHEVVVQNPELLERLWVEARAANRIGHPGVVQVSEAGALDDGTGYLVMEFLTGQTLTQRIKQHPQGMPLSEALRYAVQIASTLNAGHQKNIIHRDLKPDNVMLVADDAVPGGERVKLLDYGIAKIGQRRSDGAELTEMDMGLGTPGYMAPEQMRDAAKATDRSDVYALGALLFELLSGRRPYVAPSTADLVVMALSQDAPSIAEVASNVPPKLPELLSRMLRREPPSSRPTMVEVLRELVEHYAAHAEKEALRIAPISPALGAEAVSDTASASASGKAQSDAIVPPNQRESTQPADAAKDSAEPMPSRSTISQATGQKANGLVPRRRWVAVAAFAGTLCLFIALGWLFVLPPRREPPKITGVGPAPLTADTHKSNAPPAPVAAAPKTAEVEPPHLEPVPPPHERNLQPMLKPGPRALMPDAACVQGPKLSSKARRIIAGALAKARIRLFSSERIILIPQGANTLEVHEAPGHVTKRQEGDLVRVLSDSLSADELPKGLQYRVTVQCSEK